MRTRILHNCVEVEKAFVLLFALLWGIERQWAIFSPFPTFGWLASELWDVGLPCAVLCAMRTWSTWLLILYGMLAYLVLCCAISGMLSSSFNTFADIFIGIN